MRNKRRKKDWKYKWIWWLNQFTKYNGYGSGLRRPIWWMECLPLPFVKKDFSFAERMLMTTVTWEKETFPIMDLSMEGVTTFRTQAAKKLKSMEEMTFTGTWNPNGAFVGVDYAAMEERMYHICTIIGPPDYIDSLVKTMEEKGQTTIPFHGDGNTIVGEVRNVRRDGDKLIGEAFWSFPQELKNAD